MGLLDKWNKNKFSIYSSEEKTVLKLIKVLTNWLESLIIEVDNKTDLYGDHKGSWQGLNKPTLSEEGMRATVELHDTKINDINNKLSEHDAVIDEIPYENFTGENIINFDGKYKNFNGFNNFSKKTYGTYEKATVTSIIANKDFPVPEVLGTDTKGLATYTNRDSVALYVENNGSQPFLTIISGMSYTDTKAIVPIGVDISEVVPGMILDIGTTINDDWAVGIIKEINGRELITVDGFYKVRNDGVEPTKVTPAPNLPCKIQMTNKIWGINSNIFINDGCPAGANMELGIISNTANINDVGGIDIVNLGKATHYGVRVRKKDNEFIDGFISDGNGRHFVGKQGTSTTPLLQGIDNNGNVFEITMDGALNKEKYKIQMVTSNANLADNVAVVFMNGNNLNLTLPFSSQNTGRIIEIISTGTGNLITAQDGNSIQILETQTQQISISKEKQIRVMRLIADGGNVWFLLNDLK